MPFLSKFIQYIHFQFNSFINFFFSTFKWALSQDGKIPLTDGIEHPELPEGAGEFLDAWLMLLEKMVNPRMVLESPHTMPSKPPPNQPDFVPFDPVQYLIRTHKVNKLIIENFL